MAELHEALKILAPTNWEDVPKSDLGAYLSRSFEAGELLCNTVSPGPNGTPFDTAQPHFTVPNSANSANDIYPSPARPPPPFKDHEDLRSKWGKPMKFSKKENPLEVALYRMAGQDRHGQWYARHSVEEGLGFSKFKKALMREFPETLLTTGAPGAGAKRGLSAERRVERIDVDGIGRVEVYQLSAQMPSPVTAREFLTLFLTTDQGLTEKSGADVQDGSKHVPRHFMIVSRPLEHPEASRRANFVRGQYESIELIREIPLHASKSSSSDLPNGQETNDVKIDPELNPVEWIMVTRSDPAGGVPRFLVDRGTPGAMLTDVTKFLDWACGQEDVSDPDEDLELQRQASQQAAEEQGAQDSTKPATATREAVAKPAEQPTGVATEPAATASLQDTEAGQLSDSSSDSSSMDSFLSAEEMKRMSTAREGPPRESTENLSIASGASSSELSKTTEKQNLNQHDKEVLKITQQRERLDQRLAKKRQDQETRLKQSQEKEESEQGKAREKMEKEIQRTEERHRKEIEKLEAKRQKELRKAEERRNKRQNQDKLSLVARERDESRSQAELLSKENDLLRDQVETLQRENTTLVGRIGKLGGPDALKSVRDEIGLRTRTGTMKSGDSGSSLHSGGSSDKKEG